MGVNTVRRGICLVLLMGAGCAPQETVLVYSPHGRDMLRDYEALFEAAYPEIDMQFLDMGSQDVYSRIAAERSRPACDVWWGAPTSMFMQAAEDGLLQPYEPSWSKAIDPAHRDPEHRWYGTHLTPLAIMFNNRHYTRDQVPQSWDELIAPEWDDKVTIRKPPPSGTMRTFIGAMMLRAESEEEGLEYLRRLHESTEEYVNNPQLLFDHLKRNEELVTVWIMPDAVLQRERNGYPFDFYLPDNTPVLTEGIAIVEGAPNLENAKKFYEFVTTIESLVQQAHEYAKIPARTDIDPARLPDWMVEQEIHPMDIDWDEFAENEKRWVELWEREVFSAR